MPFTKKFSFLVLGFLSWILLLSLSGNSVTASPISYGEVERVSSLDTRGLGSFFSKIFKSKGKGKGKGKTTPAARKLIPLFT